MEQQAKSGCVGMAEKKAEQWNGEPEEDIKKEQTDKELTPRRSKDRQKRRRISLQPYGLPLFMLVIGLGFGILAGIIFSLTGDGATAVNKKVYAGLKKAAVQDFKGAAIHFDRLEEEEKKRLEAEEKAGIFKAYLLNSQLDKALDIDPERAEELVAHLQKRGNLEIIKNVNSTAPPIAFEKAAIQNDYKTMLRLKDTVEVTDARQKKILEALIMTGDAKGAVKYAKEQKIGYLKEEMEWNFTQYAKEKGIGNTEYAQGLEAIRGLE